MPLDNDWTEFGGTDIGLVRTTNQDAYAAHPTLGLFIVADGMGGHAGGEIASRLAIESVTGFFENFADATQTAPVSTQSNEQLILQAIENAQSNVLVHAKENPTLKGMGTTLVIVRLSMEPFPLATVGHVGDSRAYIYRKNQLTPLTRDHSLIEQYIEQGKISLEEAATHPHRHILTQAVGLEDPFQPTITTYPLLPEDLILLCTDGLTKMLDDLQIGRIFQKNGKDLEKIGKELIRGALQQGGEDNITVVLCTTLGDCHP